MTEAAIKSKEIIVAIIAFAIGMIVDFTGIAFPLTPEQIYAAGVAGMAIIRVFWTEGKITSVLPRKT